MTGSEILLLGLVVIAAVVAGYFIGRWSADREIGQRSARPNPLPTPDELPDVVETDTELPRSSSRQRGTPPPASAGGDYGDAPQAPRRSSAPPPAAAGGEPTDAQQPDASGTRRQRRGPPPPAAAGVMGTGGSTKRDH